MFIGTFLIHVFLSVLHVWALGSVTPSKLMPIIKEKISREGSVHGHYHRVG